jgi:glycosyltransferase involved in cell wall biosynthesis
MNSKKILLIAFFYPPSRSSGVYRALAMGNHLADQGHDVTVLTTTRSFFELESGPPDESLVARIDPRITIIRVPFSTRPVHRSLDLMSRGMARFGPILERLVPRSFRSKLSAFALRSGGSFFPAGLVDRYRTWYGPSMEAVTESMDVTELDAVIATGNPWTSFAIARTISQLSGAPYVMDYRDPWKIDVRTGKPTLRSAETEQFELEMLEGAAFITHPNQHLADEYARLFPSIANRLRVMENGFDPETLPEIDTLRPIRTEESSELVYGTLGTVSDMWPLAEFGEAWRTYVTDHPGHRFDLAGHLGWFDSGRAGLATKLDDIGDGASYVGPRARADVPDFYASLDVVVMFFWGDKGLTAGKMYEVGAIGLPILCIQPEGGGVRTFLERDHPRAVCVAPDPAQILEGLWRVEALSREMTTDERAQIRTELSRTNRTSLLAPIDELAGMAGDR